MEMTPLIKWGSGFVAVMALLIGASIFFAPAQREARQSYSVIHEQSGSRQATLFIEAPVGVSDEKLREWAQELEQSKSNGSQTVMINFYNGGRGAQNMIATYQEGTLTRTR